MTRAVMTCAILSKGHQERPPPPPDTHPLTLWWVSGWLGGSGFLKGFLGGGVFQQFPDQQRLASKYMQANHSACFQQQFLVV